MNLRTKLLLVFAALAFLPLLVVSALNYRSGVRAVEEQLREHSDRSAARMTQRIERVLETQETRLLGLADAPSLREFVRDSRAAQTGDAATSQTGGATEARAGTPPAAAPRRGKPDVPNTVYAHFTAFFKNNREYFESVTCLDSGEGVLFRLKEDGNGEVIFQTENFVSGEVKPAERVWSLAEPKALRSHLSEKSYGETLLITVPVYAPEGGGAMGAVVAEVWLKELIEDAAENEAPEAAGTPDGAAPPQSHARRNILALDNASDHIVYHTNSGNNHQTASTALSYMAGVVSRMRSGVAGFDIYDAPDGDRWLAAFRQVRGLGLSLAVAEDYTAATAAVRRSGLAGVAFALLAGVAALALLFLIARRATRDIERVARGASAIAAGDLDQRIEVTTTGETRELAESFNRMSDRLRELIRREAETKQFESFMRLSAMLSHDLKNAIAGLSMLVTNMERQFHREEFRADAIESLRDATEKLKRTVARLNEPVKSLSGEYRRAARPADLVPLIRRVLAVNAEPSRPLYDIETRLPETLVVTVEADRIENVIENLVINALEAMGARGGRLTVEAVKQTDDLVCFSVADTGVGMSEEFIKTRLFRPFATTKNKGIGLGLFTCREIVEAHGGRLEVESQPGVGTRFRVVLPSRLFTSGERQKQPKKGTVSVSSSEPGVK